MQPISINPVTPQNKIVGINNKFGNRGIRKQQGTTRIIYDTLSLALGVDVFRFFDGVNTRAFPETNVGQSGTGLQVGESLSIDRIYLAIEERAVLTPFNIIDFTNVNTNPAIAVGTVTIKIANTIVLKPIPISNFIHFYNKNSRFLNHSVFQFDTAIILPPLLEFVVEVRTVIAVAQAGFALRLTLGGVGAILAPRTTF